MRLSVRSLWGTDLPSAGPVSTSPHGQPAGLRLQSGMLATLTLSPPRMPSVASRSAAPSLSPSVEAAEDAALVGRFNRGDGAAFCAIMDRYRRRMWAVAFRVLRNNADAEEIAQDTFLRAHRGLATFRGECSLSTWLHRIALNLARNRYWYFFRRQRHASMSLEMPLGSENPVSLGELIASDEMGPVRDDGIHFFETPEELVRAMG